ncbi:unnamed protein product [Vitrella brassicaformis CCMP3155]|uniref:Ubiquitin-like domain-containing protein n=2 Tax=Vitrella brassicaformis TaxID=1169539 RepID=A0A0G4ESV0_VITBC|nr:unnamed protein product [Vitrella brassicaformis CCMP3155]|mmetsp:Transcript_42672/g.106552  ORF Transcript_42672/g.106552 Transcript_42672/m.106552 type:complete len:199 (+) Transcript_42672:231-827(+)|eukprot:CEM00786.1 unnamed protein product [Vitrella brassicaformis CCMP3155]
MADTDLPADQSPSGPPADLMVTVTYQKESFRVPVDPNGACDQLFQIMAMAQWCVVGVLHEKQHADFTLHGIKPAPKGVANVTVTFSIDGSAIVTVSAEDRGTGNRESVRMPSPVGTEPAVHVTVIWQAEKKQISWHIASRSEWLTRAWHKDFGAEPNTYRFYYRGEPVYDDDTASSLGIEDGDVIEATREDRPTVHRP